MIQSATTIHPNLIALQVLFAQPAKKNPGSFLPGFSNQSED
nr:hypothetical protein [Bradyrhizobium diazoefficiens]